MLLQLLKLVGFDLPATIAEALAEFEKRLLREARGVCLLAALVALGGVAALASCAIGLIALDRWVAALYGPFAGYGVTGGLLFVTALALFAAAILKARSLNGPDAARAAAGGATDAAPAVPASAANAVSSAAASGTDLLEPLTLILAKFLSFPSTGNPLLDELLFHLRTPARGAVDDAVERAAAMIRSGESDKLLGALGAAVFVGWLLAPQPIGRHTVQ